MWQKARGEEMRLEASFQVCKMAGNKWGSSSGVKLNPILFCGNKDRLYSSPHRHFIAISMVEPWGAVPFAVAGSGLGWTVSSLRMLEPAIFTSFR
jgi:hypothetical protein